MNSRYDDIFNRLRNIAVEYVNSNEVTDDELRNYIYERFIVLPEISYMTISDQSDIQERIFNSIRGLGLLDDIMNDENITEIMINGPDNIFVEKNGRLTKLDKAFESEKKLEDIIQRIVGTAGREVNQANPIVDTRLKNGSRVNVVMPPISLCGPIVTIRKFSSSPMTFERLVKYGSLTWDIVEILKKLVKAKFNIFVSGGTGSGKTTFLNALSNFIPADERVITIEDSAELQITSVPNLVRLETRNSNSSGAGAITIRDLIKSALRMRPERIVVGEVRGAEALDMLQAMNTGHDGSLSTGHANSAYDMLSRLETMVLTGAEGLPLPAIRQQIASAVDIIIHLSRMRDKSRKTVSISEIKGINAAGNIELNPLFEFLEDSSLSDESRVVGSLVRTNNQFMRYDKLRNAGITEAIFDEC
ncbi:CpaF family protein [Ruminococcus sp.]|uniref:CpaF family protein n=1 Tax=Ruminococcus sp. TaxID=41978 RepID=UPI0025E937CC|nr:CpaF family protein [Ruminococcus sp.]MBR1432374.1 CpaF family protein [Ruminococcus sp.]